MSVRQSGLDGTVAGVPTRLIVGRGGRTDLAAS